MNKKEKIDLLKIALAGQKPEEVDGPILENCQKLEVDGKPNADVVDGVVISHHFLDPGRKKDAD